MSVIEKNLSYQPELTGAISKYFNVKAEREFIENSRKGGIQEAQIQMYAWENLSKFFLEFGAGVKKTHVSYKLGLNDKLIYPGTSLAMEQLLHEAVYKSAFGDREQSELEGWQKMQTMLSNGQFNQVLQLSGPDSNNSQHGDYGFLFWFCKKGDTVTNHILRYNENKKDLNKTRALALNLGLETAEGNRQSLANSLLALPKGINADFKLVQKELIRLGFSFNNKGELLEKALAEDSEFMRIYQTYQFNLLGNYFNPVLAEKKLAEMFEIVQFKAAVLGLLDIKTGALPFIFRGGSCPIINYGMSNYDYASYLYEPFVCPKCFHVSYSPVGESCPNCKITKKEWKKISENETCD